MGKRGPVPKHSDERRRRNKGPSEKEKLMKQAAALEVPGRSKMTKRQLEQAIADAGRVPAEVVSSPARGSVAPPAEDGWHPIARRWYESLAASGQSDFYEESDWALAQLTAESISRDLLPQVVGVTDDGDVIEREVPIKGASLAAYLKSMTALMVSEADRRRAGIELKRSVPEAEPADPKVTSIAKYRAKVGLA